MGENGKTLTYEGCDADAVEAINDANVTDAKRRALRATLAASCNTGIYSPKELPIWKPVRGQCTTYRQEQQSCIGGWHARGHCSRTHTTPGVAAPACHAHESARFARGSRRVPR